MDARNNRLAGWPSRPAAQSAPGGGASRLAPPAAIRKRLPRTIGRFTLAAIVMLFGVAALACGWAFYLQQTGNFHIVEPGAVYRSNTLGTPQLRQVLHDYGIKSIINLRGGSDSDAWYRSEGETAKALGVTRIDIAMSDSAMPSDDILASLVEALKTSPKPVLIHCKAGADRTGLAAALYEYLVAHKPADVAAGQLSFLYGHFPWYPSRTGAMDQTFWRVAADHAQDLTEQGSRPNRD